MTGNLEPVPTSTAFEFITVDVFTKQRYHGNPLAVVLIPTALRDQISQEVKQRIAREFNLSETVFLHVPDVNSASGSVSSSCRADIFTPETELPFAGHPSIGTAHLVLNHLRWDISALQLKAGTFPITRLPQVDGQSGESTVPRRDWRLLDKRPLDAADQVRESIEARHETTDEGCPTIK